MNKLDLIKRVMEECRLSRNEAATVVDLFLKICLKRLQGVTGLKFADCVLSMLKNTSPTKAEIPKPAKALR